MLQAAGESQAHCLLPPHLGYPQGKHQQRVGAAQPLPEVADWAALDNACAAKPPPAATAAEEDVCVQRVSLPYADGYMSYMSQTAQHKRVAPWVRGALQRCRRTCGCVQDLQGCRKLQEACRSSNSSGVSAARGATATTAAQQLQARPLTGRPGTDQECCLQGSSLPQRQPAGHQHPSPSDALHHIVDEQVYVRILLHCRQCSWRDDMGMVAR